MVRSSEGSCTLVAVGDVSPNRDDPPSIFRFCGDVFHNADIVFGQMEATLSDRGTPMPVPIGSPCKLAAKNIAALTGEGAGFDVMSFACNHAMDYGKEAFYDTLDVLKGNNIAVVGAGKNIVEARAPVIIERNGVRIGFLAYLDGYCVANPSLVAHEDSPGCAPMRATHRFEQVHPSPGTPPLIVTKLFPEDKAAIEEDVRKLRSKVDVLVVSMHCGVVYVPAMVAMYQKEAAYAAIDNGADLILQHHAHILKGIEVYKGKVIFYGLGNFALEHSQPFPGKIRPSDHGPEVFRRAVCHVKAVPGYEKVIFGRDSLKTMVAKVYVEEKKIQRVTYIPAYITPNLEPEVLRREDPRAQEVFDYVCQISDTEDLNAHFSWRGEEVLITG